MPWYRVEKFSDRASEVKRIQRADYDGSPSFTPSCFWWNDGSKTSFTLVFAIGETMARWIAKYIQKNDTGGFSSET